MAYGMSLADAVEPLPLRMDALPSLLSFWDWPCGCENAVEDEDEDSMVYLKSGSLLPPPVARPSDALRKRNRSFRRHFLLPLPQPRIMEVRGDGGDEGESSSSKAPPPPLNGDRERVALLLLDEAAAVVEAAAAAGLLLDLPLSTNAASP
jgi:hypothetical protein